MMLISNVLSTPMYTSFPPIFFRSLIWPLCRNNIIRCGRQAEYDSNLTTHDLRHCVTELHGIIS